jgi:hypothetical protein
MVQRESPKCFASAAVLLIDGNLEFSIDISAKSNTCVNVIILSNMKLPTPLGLHRSFGFGDRLGLATPGHLAALSGSHFLGIFAQQSIREMARTNRTPGEVMSAAVNALQKHGYDQPWGADADHLKTPEDVRVTAQAGFTFFTIDPSAYVNNGADSMSESALREEVQLQNSEKLYGEVNVEEWYLGKSWQAGATELRFNEEALLRAAVKYGRAVAHVEKMARAIATETGGRPYEIEVSVDETDSPTSPLEHLFFALELQRRQVKVISLAPRFIGEFEKGIDYKGDRCAFAHSLRLHCAIAETFGPYKISIHSGSDKFSIYPTIGEICGDLLHVKTAGTSYLEALRVVARTEQNLFREIVEYSAGRFAEDRVSYHISVTESDIPGLLQASANEREQVFLNENHGRQMLHVTFGSVLTKGVTASGQSFKQAILETLARHSDLHEEVLCVHLGKHIRLLEGRS